MEIRSEMLIRVAKRLSNPRRSYLLVNPLQGKHLPAAPAAVLELSRILGRSIRSRFPDAGTVLGFAETATAIAAGAAAELTPDCVLGQTTRELGRPQPEDGFWIHFTEDHSHARSQALFLSPRLQAALRSGRPVVIIDDEITTGKTCLHLVEALRECASASGPIVLASLIGRCSSEDRARLSQAGIETLSLLELGPEDYEEQMRAVSSQPAAETVPAAGSVEKWTAPSLPDPRFAAEAGRYEQAARYLAAAAGAQILEQLSGVRRVLVLGTEECMYPAICTGAWLEEAGLDVRTHSTTRSPIGICTAPDYPIRAGFRLPSFYEPQRQTFLYNPAAYDAVIAVTDATGELTEAMAGIQGVFRPLGTDIFCVIQIPESESAKYEESRDEQQEAHPEPGCSGTDGCDAADSMHWYRSVSEQASGPQRNSCTPDWTG